jgi:hypothetical protein
MYKIFNHDTRIFHPWQLVVMGIACAMLFCLVASYDVDQVQQDQALYCENVKLGAWPAYDKTILCKD